ncbi:unnamed protein product [Closterium sp. Yama58-4]|nr:unnamed protein product [Closterium sp. Yama58-4]
MAPGCSICYEEFVAEDSLQVVVECGHVFHTHCLQQWLECKPRKSCPFCRGACSRRVLHVFLSDLSSADADGADACRAAKRKKVGEESGEEGAGEGGRAAAAALKHAETRVAELKASLRAEQVAFTQLKAEVAALKAPLRAELVALTQPKAEAERSKQRVGEAERERDEARTAAVVQRAAYAREKEHLLVAAHVLRGELDAKSNECKALQTQLQQAQCSEAAMALMQQIELSKDGLLKMARMAAGAAATDAAAAAAAGTTSAIRVGTGIGSSGGRGKQGKGKQAWMLDEGGDDDGCNGSNSSDAGVICVLQHTLMERNK